MDHPEVHTQAVTLIKDPATEGFDLLAGQSWIYPTNYPTREYQFNIIQKALLKNTLVSLPTGLGKTFIAAVIMYNFYRWYPQGKIIFMAPTKPLVKQQIDACYNVMAIPPEVTAELTGAKVSSARADIWADKRVFFITPQVLQNDLNRISELGSNIKCLVFDEAHKARGNHAYCEVIRRLIAGGSKYFRVLALSATPGNTVDDVLEIIQNLLISHLEFRTEESIDVQPYVFNRSLETVVVPLSDKLIEVRDEYLKILEYYTRSLRNYKVIQGNCGALTKGKIFMLMKEYQRNRGAGSPNYGEIMKSLNICITLYHAFELLIRHGLRNFLSFFDEHLDKPLLKGNNHLRIIVNGVREYLGPVPNVEVLPDGTYPEVPTNTRFGHPKYYKLRDILVEHFSESDKNTRVIVFFEYRESVMEAHLLLLQSRPLIQPKIFLGQGSGITQKIQIGVVKAFREGKCNTLLSTCIGEEGLDVGEVDLIICFDISSKSPIRMVQRMGRTGRKREGKVLILVTEGKEQQTLKDCLIYKNNISTFVLGSKQLSTGMYPDSPRLVPDHITPRCERIFITVKKPASKKKNSIKDMFNSISRSSSSEPAFSQDIQIIETEEKLTPPAMLFDKSNPLNLSVKPNILGKHIEMQRSLQKVHKIEHSKQSAELVKLMQYADSKRFNIPTQSLSQSNARILKQGDLRNMFLKSTATQVPISVLDIPTQQLLEDTEDILENSTNTLLNSKELFSQVSNYTFLQTININQTCPYCPKEFSCEDYAVPTKDSTLLINKWIPSEKILENITSNDIKEFMYMLDPSYQKESPTEPPDLIDNGTDKDIFDNIDFSQIEKEVQEESFAFQAPKTLSKIFDKFGDTIFSSPKTLEPINEQQLLDFFILQSLTELFVDVKMDSSQETIIYSPDVSILKETPVSPDLSSENRLKSIRKKLLEKNKKIDVQKKWFEGDQSCDMDNTQKSLTSSDSPSLISGVSKHKNDVRKSVDIDDICDLSSFGMESGKTPKLCEDTVDDICNLSDFGFSINRDVKSSNQQTPFSQSKRAKLDEHVTSAKSYTVSTKPAKSANSSQKIIDVADADLSDFVDNSFLDVLPTSNEVEKKTSAKDVVKEAVIEKTDIVDLTQDSPEKCLPTKLLAKSQLSITQMLSFINKSQQSSPSNKNIVEKHISPTPKFNTTLCSSTQVASKQILSTRKNVDNNFVFSTPKSKTKRKNDKNPYEFLSQKLNYTNNHVEIDSSDDEFEKPKKSPVFLKPKPINSKTPERNRVENSSKLKSRKKENPFVDAEAELSEDDSVFISDDESDEENDHYEKSFVNDETQNFCTQMHAHYLKSVRSPANRGRFKIPTRRALNVTNVYSQAVDNEDNTYLEDSFVVDTEDNHLTQENELSVLEILEKKLKKKNKKRKKSDNKLPSSNKRRRILTLSSDDSD